MTDTKGNGIINTIFDGYEEYKGDIQYRKQGSIIAFEDGESITYGLYNAHAARAITFLREPPSSTPSISGVVYTRNTGLIKIP